MAEASFWFAPAISEQVYHTNDQETRDERRPAVLVAFFSRVRIVVVRAL